MEEKSVAVIVVNWNNAQDTIDCVNSLKKINYKNFKVFLVDNGSTDGSLEKLRPFADENIEIIETGKNLGFSGGNNVAVEKALAEKFDFILLLNNDTTVDPDFLGELVKVAEGDPKIGIVGSKIYFYDNPKRIWYGGGKFTWFGGGRHLQYEEIDKNPEESNPKETGYMTGCSFLIKSEVVRKIGGLDERFFLYYEDTDWSLSTKEVGYKIVYAPSSKVYHKVSRTASQIGDPIIHYYHIRNALLLSQKHAPFFILIGIYIWSAVHYLKQVIKMVILPSKRDISKMIMRGIKDFHKGRFGQYKS